MKKKKPGDGMKDSFCAAMFLEELIEACVLELYFSEEAVGKTSNLWITPPRS